MVLQTIHDHDHHPFSSSKTIFAVMVVPNLNINPNTTSLRPNPNTIQNQNTTCTPNQNTIPIIIQDQSTNLGHNTIQNQNTILRSQITIGNHSTILNQHITTIQAIITCPPLYDHLYHMCHQLLYHSIHYPNHPLLVFDLMDIPENITIHTKNIKVNSRFRPTKNEGTKMRVIQFFTRSPSWEQRPKIPSTKWF